MNKRELKIRNSNIILYNEDCLSRLKLMESESVDCAIVDSPYNIDFKNKHSEELNTWDTREIKEYIEFSKNWLNEIYRILKPNGTCWSFFGRTKIREWLEIVDNTKFINRLENWITYSRSKGRNSTKKLKSLAEEIWMLTKSDNYTWNQEEYLRRVIAAYKKKGGEKMGWTIHETSQEKVRYTGLGNVIPIFTALKEEVEEDRRGVVLDVGSGERLPLSGDIYNLQFPLVPSVLNKLEKQCHSAQKATLILVMLILLSSNEGDTILDCFGGSFSTGAASVLCDRNFIGIEQEKETFDKGLAYLNNFKYDKWETYVKSHIVSAEKGFKFGVDLNETYQKIKNKV